MTTKVKTKIFVMMSGGVDSSVAALLLRDQGFEVTGVFMKNWSPNSLQSLTDCPWERDLQDARAVAKQLRIKFRSVNFEREYRRAVIDYFLREYRAGRTPNPDVVCNQQIKFGVFLNWARRQGADLVASGHYARVVEQTGRRYVARGRDRQKDQSYFLWTLGDEVLRQVIFPLGELTKTEVRRLARAASLPVAAKQDSQGICFVGQINVTDFLKAELGTKPGAVQLVTLANRVVGRHQGAHLYTIGQRHGFAITKPQLVAKWLLVEATSLPPLFVVAKDLTSNTITVGQEQDALLDCRSFLVESVIWHDREIERATATGATPTLKIQVRYRQHPVTGSLTRGRFGQYPVEQYKVKTIQAVRAVAPGQFAVFYQREIIVGGGVISENIIT